MQEQRLPDGRYNLLLHGMTRASVIEEVGTDKLYRIARVELCQDIAPSKSQEKPLREILSRGVMPFFSAHPLGRKQLKQLLNSPLPLGSLCDIFAYALPIEVDVKQQLLDTLCVQSRVRLLLTSLEGMKPETAEGTPRRVFPPEFSEN
jgi:Lon protease-like protein